LAECSDSQIDINSASSNELEKIVWIGPATAQKIVDSRPFSSVDDLDRVKGIGVTKLGDIKDEGLAGVSGEDKEDENEKEVDEEVDEKILEENNSGIKDAGVEEEPETLVLNQEVDKPILLNGEVTGERELVYESKNAKISRYFPYAFSLFLIFVIVVLLLDK
jgi:hypothetical protein